jgi:prophage regulatory protein
MIVSDDMNLQELKDNLYQLILRKPPRIIRHSVVRDRLSVSAAKLFDMIAKGQFPKPFTIVPGGRAVGWLESDVDAWIVERSTRRQP